MVGTCAVWNCPEPLSGKKPAWPPKDTPTRGVPPGLNPDSAKPPDACCQLSPEVSPPQHHQIRPAMPLGPKPNQSLGLQASIPKGLAPKPPRLRTPEKQPMTLPATREDTLQFGAALSPQRERNLHTPRKPPPPLLAHLAKSRILPCGWTHTLNTALREPVSAPADQSCKSPRP